MQFTLVRSSGSYEGDYAIFRLGNSKKCLLVTDLKTTTVSTLTSATSVSNNSHFKTTRPSTLGQLLVYSWLELDHRRF